jgi:hypothetical protein
MKKTSILLGLVTMSFFASAQLPVRMALYEEFTGENCPPCAATNPGLDALLAANPTKVIALKWQVPIPSAPSATWSLYRTNQAEINWRYQGSGYGYQSQNTATTAPTNGINSAPSGKMNGDNVWVYGAASNHPANLTTAAINAAQTATTPFSINMGVSWDATFDNAVVTVTVSSAATFTCAGPLMYRLCLVERRIEFATPSGSNGEKLFHDVVRKSYPTTTSGTVVTGMGTALPTSWTNGQTQTFTLNCAIPSYIVDKGEMAFVGFIQDDANKKIWQANRTAQPAIPNEAKAVAVNISSVMCTNTLQPTVSIKNNGANAITDMTITPYFNGTPGSNIIWTGNLAIGATTNIAMNVVNPIAGSNTFSFNIINVSGGDVVMSNNSARAMFLNSTNYATVAVNEGFQATTFPPTNWTLFNPDGGTNTFVRATNAGGFGLSTSSTRIFVNGAGNGLTDHLVLPPTSLTGTVAPQLTFDLAYCQVSSGNNDRLEVFVSGNCGTTWTSVYMNQGASMATAPLNNATAFVPTATQWTAVTVSLPTFANNPGVIVRFAVTPNNGNQLYLDNINLKESASSVGLNTENALGYEFELFPNPATDDINLRISSKQSSNATVKVVNALGQIVYTDNTTLNEGTTGIRIDSKEFAPGFYQVILESNNSRVVKKVSITK